MSDVSVVMGTYNGARHVEEQLRTVLDQTEPPLEVLVGDDGSDDDTCRIVERVARDSVVPIRLQRNAVRLGFADNFLTTAGRASGRFVAFCDQDDRWRPEKLARGRSALLRHDALLSVHPVALVSADGVPSGVVDQQAPAGVIEPRSAFQWRSFFGFTMLFERALLDVASAGRRGGDIHTPGAPLPHDRWVSFLALNLGRTVVLPDVLADYRQHGGQLYGSGAGGASALEKRVDWGRRALARVGTSAARLDLLGDVAEGLAAVLEDAPPTPLGDVRLAAARWRRLAHAYRRRGNLHAGRSPLGSVRVVAEGFRAGAYGGPAQAGLGRQALIEDLTLGLLPHSTGRSS